jgi:hypothetical protein
MYRFKVIPIFTLLLTMVLSASGTMNLAPASGSLILNSNNDSGLTLTSELAEIEHLSINTPEGLFTLLQVADYSYSHRIGKPQLPVKRTIIAVPLGAEVSASVTESWIEQFNLTDWGITDPVIPAQPSLSKSQLPEDVPFAYDADAYGSSARSPQPLVQLEELGILRGQRLFVIELAPVQYTPATGQLSVYSHLEVEVTFSGADQTATDELRARTFSPYFESMYQSQLFNYRPLNQREDLTRYPIKYVIVADPMFEAQLAPFIEWKTQQGYNVITGYIGTDFTFSTASIAAWIQDIWDDSTPSDPAPSFVLFVGDDSEIPAYSGTTGGHITDLHYVTLEGGDYMPEIYYGRFSAQTPAQLQPQIDKTLEYERYLMPDPSYLGEVVMIAGMDGSYGATHGNGQINYGTDYYFNGAHGITSHTYLYPNSGGNSANIIADVSGGVGYVNYTAHGSQTSWADPSFTIANINSLQNDHEYPTVVGNCCLTNAFNTSTCFGEAWLRAENKGAIGYIGGTNNTYWDEDYWWGVGAGSTVANPTFETHGPGAYDGMFHDHGEAFSDWYTTQYAVIMAGNLAVVEGGGNMNYYWEIYSLMGDPSLSTFFGVPTVNTVNYPTTIFIGQDNITIQAEPYSYVGLSMDGELAAGRLVDASGTLVLGFTPFTNAGTADLVITRQNRQPRIAELEVIPNAGPYVTLNSYSPATAEYGQSIPLDVVLENIGTVDAVSVSAILTTADSYVTITDNSESFGTINAGDTVNGYDAYGFTVDGVVPDQHQVNFTLTITGTTRDEWVSYLTITLDAPEMATGMMVVDDSVGGNGNGRLDPGEDALLIVPINNSGHAATPTGLATLVSSSPNITVTDDSDNISAVPGGDSVNATFSVTVAAEAQIGDPAEFDFEWNAGDFNLTDNFYRTIGLVLEDFETGNFTAFPWEMSGNADWIISASAYEGSFCGQSGDIDDYGTSTMSLSANVVATGDLSFQYKVSSESNYDFLRFSIDGSELASWDGEQGWAEFSTSVAAGEHIFTWSYTKDVSVSNGSDCGWIDYIIFPPMGAPAYPEIAVDPTEFNVNLEPGANSTEPLTISNSGDGELSYSILVNTETAQTSVPFMKLRKGEADPREGQVARDQGGPDGFGNFWIDSDEAGGPTYNWVEISGVGTSPGNGDDGNYGPFDLGFNFDFYGTSYSAVNICTNGFISFTSTSTTYTNQGIPDSSDPNCLIAPFWDDLNPSSGGTIYYYADAVNQRFIVEWDGVNHYYDSSPETFQVILNADGTILYQYATVALNNGCTVGIENQNGSDGLQVAFNSAYLHDGLAILIDHATPWLDVTPSEGIVAPYSEVTLDVLFDATDLAEGTYTGNITVNSNDQDESTLVIPVTLTVGATTLDPVDDLTITISGGYIVLNWSDVYGATQYRMSNCSTPYGEFEYVGTTSFTTWTTPLTGEVQFFQVTATDE